MRTTYTAHVRRIFCVHGLHAADVCVSCNLHDMQVMQSCVGTTFGMAVVAFFLRTYAQVRLTACKLALHAPEHRLLRCHATLAQPMQSCVCI